MPTTSTASRIVNADAVDLPAKPVFKADPMNVTLVVEHGDHHITVLDGDLMEPIIRFATRYALHGGPKFTQDGRFVFWATRDGWITKFDLWNLKVVAETRAGINTRNVAVSSDGKLRDGRQLSAAQPGRAGPAPTWRWSR
jgi:hypothetical protein